MKANKFGIKVWVLTDDKNFLLSWFQITLVNKLNKKVWDTILFGLSVNHIWTNADIFSRLFFTSANLMRDLELRGTYTCSTVHTDRRDYPAELKHAKLVPGEIRTHQCRIGGYNVKGQTCCISLINKHSSGAQDPGCTAGCAKKKKASCPRRLEGKARCGHCV